MKKTGLLVAAMLATMLLAGCTEGEPQNAAQEVDPCLVENPGDFDACQDDTVGVDGTVAHVHDYWGGRDKLTILDVSVGTGGQWFGDPIAWAEARPDKDNVVPPGTASVDVTVSWETPGVDDWFANPQLWVRKASDSEAQFVADLSNGETVTMDTVTEDADLPHQQLSGWVFQWVISVPDDVRPATYSGDVDFTVIAHRGLPIPEYPGHPDRWDNQTEILLLEANDDQIFFGDGTSGNWGCFTGCPEIHTPMDGVIVPFDADRVVVTLTLHQATPFDMGVAFHGGDTRDFARPVPTSVNELTKTYVIPVESMGDGPYAVQSLWEFAVYIEGPQEDGFTLQGWELDATVYRHAAS